MNNKDLFESGCFSPDWTTDTEPSPISAVYTRQNKDLQTLLKELDGIKDRIQEIQAKQWQLAKLIHFHENELVKE
uniref:Uncharacterized protein n=1 Tax=uncultured Candidatus Melainabacteria bacterium TaxID=2682970 RepID=A0A650EL83_9BACT|nr:hypothetical protein Melaina855_2650 [uncultured Candidatus Melainabacteria bacterium]